MKKKYTCAFIVISFLALSCNGGLDPDDAEITSGKAKLTGTIHFIGGVETWPPEDSVHGIRAAAFKETPPFETDSLIADVLNEEAYLTFNSLPLFVDSANFDLNIGDAPVELKYIAVALQYDTTIYDQKAVGVYTESGNKTKPSSLNILPNDSIHINIEVDFSNLPPEPFK